MMKAFVFSFFIGSAVLFHHINNKTMPDSNTENGWNKKGRGEGNTEKGATKFYDFFPTATTAFTGNCMRINIENCFVDQFYNDSEMQFNHYFARK